MLRFCDGLVWTVCLTVEIKLLFQISLTECGARTALTTASNSSYKVSYSEENKDKLLDIFFHPRSDMHG